MLVLNDLSKLYNTELQGVLTEFRKVQVSRYPLELVVGNGSNLVGFMDSRFPTDRFNKDQMSAMIWWEQETGLSEKGEPIYKYTIESRLINNDKYARHNSDYYTRKTTDLKKLFKFMKEYVKPFSHQEIAQKSFRSAENSFDDWQQDMFRQVRRTVGEFDLETVMEEIVKLQALGIPAQTEKFKRMTDALPAWESYKEIRHKKFGRVHVFINPDEAVTVTTMPNGSLEAGVQVYESMEKAPELIQQHVGMLKMMDVKVFVPHVGYKASDKEFWIEGLSQ